MASHDTALPDHALDQLFREARSYNGWLDHPVTKADIEAIYELTKMGPTSANSQPGRFVWCVSQEARERLASHASEGNKDKVRTAPVCVVIGYDIDFHDELPWLFPHTDAKSWFEGDRSGRELAAARNSALQGAYLMMAARALGFDCGPMSGVDLDGVTAEFFAGEKNVRADWICAIGRGDRTSIFERSPRPDFDTFNRIA
jgi:3-hydroxypropanoate dehydrogenase